MKKGAIFTRSLYDQGMVRRAWIIFFFGFFFAACQSDELESAVYFLSWDEAEIIQVFRVPGLNQPPEQITEGADDVLFFTLSPDGRTLLTAVQTDAGTELWLMDSDGRNPRLLLRCPAAQCSQMGWHPDGRRLLYERRGNDTPNLPQLWWLDSESGDTTPLQAQADGPSQAARFSTDGNWVSFVVSPDEGVVFFNFEDGRRFTLPAELGTPAVWQPGSEMFIYRNHQLVIEHGADDGDHQSHTHDFVTGVYLFAGDVDSRSGTPISGGGVVDDGSPAFSPDGEWLALGRTLPGTDLGRQLWLMRPDGSDARPLTDEPTIHHGLPAWSPDGRFILYQRYDTQNDNGRAAIWMLEVATGEKTQISPSGFLPAWQP